MERYVVITDNKTGELIASGAVCNEKRWKKGVKTPFITLDDMYYFREDSDRYTVTNSVNVVRYHEKIPKDYKIILWSQYEAGMDVDVVREYGFDEIDPEVKSLVEALNKFPGIATSSSCCGHYQSGCYVSFRLDSLPNGLWSLSCLLNLLSDGEYPGNVYLSTLNAYTSLNSVCFSIRTATIGEPAYKLCDKLAKDIEKTLDTLDVHELVKKFRRKLVEEAYHVW